MYNLKRFLSSFSSVTFTNFLLPLLFWPHPVLPHKLLHSINAVLLQSLGYLMTQGHNVFYLPQFVHSYWQVRSREVFHRWQKDRKPKMHFRGSQGDNKPSSQGNCRIMFSYSGKKNNKVSTLLRNLLLTVSIILYSRSLQLFYLA